MLEFTLLYFVYHWDCFLFKKSHWCQEDIVNFTHIQRKNRNRITQVYCICSIVPASFCWLNFALAGESQRKIWVVAYFLATAAVLVPAPLIEFRYFTTPFYFLMLHSQMNGRLNWSLVALLYIALNAFTMFMFLFRPFYWENETGKQRFIW